MLVDAVVRVVLLEVCGPQEAHHRFGWAAGKHNIVLYADNGRIAGHNSIWVHTILTLVLRMFESLVPLTNFGKTKTMICITGFIWVQQGKASYKRRATGEVDTFWERKKTGVGCKECVGAMEVSYLHQHMESTHGMVLPHTRGIDFGVGVP